MFDILDQNKSMSILQIRKSQLKQIKTCMIHRSMREHDHVKDVYQPKVDMQLNIKEYVRWKIRV
jgi:hypothetical protein